jgi:hypothetical protein
VILKGPPFAPPQAKALIDKLLARGCSCGQPGEARLVKRPVGGGGIQIVLQCLTCGSSIGTAQAHAAHPDFLTYPVFDEALALSGRHIVHPLAVQASRLLGYPVAIAYEAHPLLSDDDLLDMAGRFIGVGEIIRRLQPRRAWSLQSKHGTIGIVCEGEPVTVPGIEIQRLEGGYLVLIDRKMAFVFMAEAVRRANNKGAA